MFRFSRHRQGAVQADRPAPRSGRRRDGYTLLEIAAAMASATVLVGGLASTVLISSKTLSGDVTSKADRSAAALSQLAADVRQALRFTERTATAVTFIVPDRNGDGVADTIRYSWSGTAGDSLLQQFNSEPAVAVAEDVSHFELNAITRSIVP